MKLYTEEQLLQAYDLGLGLTDDEVLQEFTPIELPSDEEIEEIIKPFEFEYTKIGFRACAEWLKNKIQGGVK